MARGSSGGSRGESRAAGRALVRRLLAAAQDVAGTTRRRRAARPPARRGAAGPAGDFTGPLPSLAYDPRPDGEPDAGEVVWAWVPYQEDATRGKDRPVLVIGRDGAWVLACPMTSKDHDRDADQERRAGRIWVDIGSGGWDSRGRPSEVGVHRVLRLPESGIRRDGAVLARERYDAVVAALRARYGGSAR